MPLLGTLKTGAGGSGQMPLRFTDLVPGVPIVSATTFGAAATTDQRVAIACVVTPGVLHTPSRNDAQQQLHLYVPTQDGRGANQQQGPAGRGLWFGGRRDLWFAIGAPPGGGAFVHRWRLPNQSTSPTNVPAVAAALLNGRFAAGVEPRERLLIVADGQPAALAVDAEGGRDTYPLMTRWPGSPVRLRLAPEVRRLVFRDEQMFVVCITARTTRGEPVPRAVIRAFALGAREALVDEQWGDAGAWEGPAGFSPIDLLLRPDGELVCAGWTAVGSAVAFTLIRIAADGRSDNQTMAAASAALATSFPVRMAVDSLGGQLTAASVPNPLASLLGPFAPPLAEWALVTRREADDLPDQTFGNQGACWAAFPGYPLLVREIVPTDTGFFLVCDRPSAIERRNIQPVVFAYDLTGRPAGSFGEAGIVHHDEIPAAFQLHEPGRAVAVGMRTVWGATPFAANTYELAVTALGGEGNVAWRYGSTHGMHSAPLVVAGRRATVAGVNAVTSWGSYLAIGGWYTGPDGFGGFVTLRYQNGAPLPAGQGTLSFTNMVLRLDPTTSGMLEVVYQVPGAYAERVLIRPDLTLDPSAPVPVAPPGSGLVLADGSRIRVHLSIFSGAFPTFRLWLTRTWPDGALDPAFGGRDPASPASGTSIDGSGFDGVRVDSADVVGVFSHPAGGFIAGIIAKRLYPRDSIPTPRGLLLTRWNADGTPAVTWGQAGTAEHPGIVVVNQAVADDPAGLVLVGAGTPTRSELRVPTLWRIRYSDGQLDPTFGTQGSLTPSLRWNESRMALPIRVRPDGTRFVPITISRFVPTTTTNVSDRAPLGLIWIEIE